jgi:hypothetical protein
MKKITLLILLFCSLGFYGQNLITNGDFQSNTGSAIDNWSGFNNQVLSDDLVSSNVGNINNGEGSLFQQFNITAGNTYQISFDYRWVSGAANYNMTVQAKEVGNLSNNVASSAALNQTPDIWHKEYFSVTPTTGMTALRLLFYKANGNRPFRVDNISIRRLATFDGSTDSDFATAGNWDTNEIPDDDDIIIPSGQDVVISSSTGVNVGNLTVDAAGTLTVNGGGSLILDGTSSGNITYNRTLQANKWHLVASPVVGETYDDAWVTTNDIETSGSGNRGIATYQNGVADLTTGQWIYMQSGGSGTFGSSTGYSLRRDTEGTVSYTGTYPTGAKPATATQNTNNFNLIGNPYPTYLSITDFFTNNTLASGKLTEETIWLWNQATGSYVAKTSALDGTFQIAPGQAFFVSSGNATDIIFYQFNGTHQADTYLKSETTKVTLNISANTNSSNTEVYYLPEGTNDFDNGYDASKFSGVASNFSLYTAQISDINKKLGRQVMSLSDMENIVVPFGVKADAGSEIIFSAVTSNLPTGLMLYVEDRLLNTFTRLDETNSNYTVTPSEALNGVGRFYMHTTSSALSIDTLDAQSISMFTTSNSTLRIVGLTVGKSNIKLFNILGKEVLNEDFQSKNVTDISLPKLAKGIYIAQLQTEKGRLNKKIILE